MISEAELRRHAVAAGVDTITGNVRCCMAECDRTGYCAASVRSGLRSVIFGKIIAD
jgi:hypothetical protein